MYNNLIQNMNDGTANITNDFELAILTTLFKFMDTEFKYNLNSLALWTQSLNIIKWLQCSKCGYIAVY